MVFLFSREMLEGYTMDQARGAIRGLLALAPTERPYSGLVSTARDIWASLADWWPL